MTHRFFFDEQTKHLRRRTSSMPTLLGAYVIQVDYEKYASIGGRQRPGLTTFKMPSVTWQRELKPQTQ